MTEKSYEQSIIDFPKNSDNDMVKEQISSLQKTDEKGSETSIENETPEVIHILPARRRVISKFIEDSERMPTPEELLLIDPNPRVFVGEEREKQLNLLAEEMEVYKILTEMGAAEDENVAYLDKRTGKYYIRERKEEEETVKDEPPIISSADAFARWQLENDK